LVRWLFYFARSTASLDTSQRAAPGRVVKDKKKKKQRRKGDYIEKKKAAAATDRRW
jgi:hypothetical protein